MFYDVFLALCKEKGVKPAAVAEACGISRSTISTWKSKGYAPRIDKLNLIADYFGVTTDYLLGQTEKPAAQKDDELAEILEEIRRNPELRTMFSVAKNATPDEIRQYINVIKAIRGEE